MHMRTAALAIALAATLGVSAVAAAPAAAADFPAADKGYHTYAEMVAEINKAQADHPEIVDIISIGKSYQGREIWTAKISDNVGTDENEPEVLFDGVHHAREHLSLEQNLAILRWLTDGYGSNARITAMVNSREIWIVFAVNPDGAEYDLGGNPYREWRKNRQPNSGSTAVGTDLNRNYGYRWGCCGGSSGSKSSLTYRGSKAFSAPETQAMRDFMASRRIGGVQQISSRSRSTPPASSSSGRTATPARTCPRHDHRGPRRARRDGQEDGQPQRLHADAIELAVRHRRRRVRLGLRQPAHLDVHGRALSVARPGELGPAVPLQCKLNSDAL